MGTTNTGLPSSATDADATAVVASAWQDQALWSQVGNQLGEAIRFWRVVAASAGITGLFFSVLVGSLRPDQLGTTGKLGLATLGVLLLALVPYLRQQLLSADRVLAWTRARNVSEQLKEALYRHMMGVLPPVPLADGSAPPDPGGPGNLVRRCRVIKQAAADLAGLAATVQPVLKPRKTSLTVADYLAERVDGQINWYRKSCLEAGRSAKRLQQAEFGLGLLTVLLGALAGKLLPVDAAPALAAQAWQLPPLVPWLALIASITAAVSSHIAGTREVELAAKYFATADLLKTLKDEWFVSPNRDEPGRVQRLVDEVERALAAEHGGWVSDWQKSLLQAQGQSPAPAAAPAAVGAVAAVGAGALLGAAAANANEAGETALSARVSDSDEAPAPPDSLPSDPPADPPSDPPSDPPANPSDNPPADPPDDPSGPQPTARVPD